MITRSHDDITLLCYLYFYNKFCLRFAKLICFGCGYSYQIASPCILWNYTCRDPDQGSKNAIYNDEYVDFSLVCIEGAVEQGKGATSKRWDECGGDRLGSKNPLTTRHACNAEQNQRGRYVGSRNTLTWKWIGGKCGKKISLPKCSIVILPKVEPALNANHPHQSMKSPITALGGLPMVGFSICSREWTLNRRARKYVLYD